MSDAPITIKVEGLDKIKSALSELPSKVSRNVLRKGVSAGGMLLRGEIKNAAPVRSDGRMMKTSSGEMRGPGYLKKHISARYRKRSSSFTEIHYGVGPAGQAFYGYFVEAGHKIGKRKRYGRVTEYNSARGNVPEHPFMIPTFNRMTGAIIEKMKDNLAAGIIGEGLKLGLKSG